MKIAAVRTHTRSSTGKERLSAVDYWRTLSPLRELAKQTGWQVDEFSGELAHDFTGYDLVWFSYMDNPVPIKELMDLGVRWSVDFDDDFLNMSPLNPVRQQYPYNSNEFKTIVWLIKNAPYLTVSTSHLARVYSKIRDPELPPPFVLENRIAPDFYPKRKYKKHEGTVFAWQGGLTHHADIFHTPFWGAMAYILGKYPQSRLKIMGGIPDDFHSEMPQVKYIEGVSDYQKFTKQLVDVYSDVDVALCPLENNVFNDSKSSIKAQEALIHSIPVVASNVRPYQELASEVSGITLVESTKEWIEALEPYATGLKSRPSTESIRLFSLPNYVERYKNYIEAIVKDEPLYTTPKLPLLKKKKLQVVISCTRFAELTGSELYSYELARSIKKLGHEVIVLSSCGGVLKEKAENEGIECVDFPEVESLSPDLIISSHYEPTKLLLSTFTCPIINVIHSENDLLWPIERPVPGCDQYVAIRDTIRNRVIKEGIHPDKVHVIMNPIDFDRFNTKGTDSDKSILFIGPKDQLRKRVIRDLKKVAKEKGLSLKIVGRGQPEPETWDTEKLTKHCEMVASIYVGRTALEGWACGKAAIIYDVNASGKILSRYIVAPPNDTSEFDSNQVAKKMLELV